MKRILINATQPEELRVAQVDGQILYDLDIERTGQDSAKSLIYKGLVDKSKPKKSGIHKGRISRIQASLQAAFVDIGTERHGFLPFKEISPEYFSTPVSPEDLPNINVKDMIKEGQEIMVQIDKEERGNKGAALTTFVSLAGCYLVLMPNNPGAGGISRRIEGDERTDMRDILSSLNIPQDMGVIIRTAGVGRSKEEIEWDLSALLSYWDAIKTAYQSRPAPFLIHQESDLVIRALRDHLRRDIGEILIDNEEVFQRGREYIQRVRPDFINRVKLYQDTVPLFTRFQIENQIESAFQREIRLPSGGAIVIDKTEALVSIDINSAKSTRGGDIEETAFHTNLEAADEIARQLRLRDIGGLIVIDFIDMLQPRHQREVENRIRTALEVDRARVQVGRISRFGLLEMSRQRLRSSLEEASHQPCPRCNGQGMVRSIDSMSLSILRLIEEDALKPNTGSLHVHVPLDIATFLLNEKREVITAIENRHKVGVIIIPNPHMDPPHYKLIRIKQEEQSAEGPMLSYQLSYDVEEEAQAQKMLPVTPMEEPAVKPLATVQPPATPVPSPKLKEEPNIIKRVWTLLFGNGQPVSKTSATDENIASAPVGSTRAMSRDRDTRVAHRGRHKPGRHGHSHRRRPRPSPHQPQSVPQEKTESTPISLGETIIESTTIETSNVTAEPNGNREASSNRNRYHRRHHRRHGRRGENTNQQAHPENPSKGDDA